MKTKKQSETEPDVEMEASENIGLGNVMSSDRYDPPPDLEPQIQLPASDKRHHGSWLSIWS